MPVLSALATRLYKPQTVSFERLVNPITKIDGLVSDLEGQLIHHPFSKGVSHWFERHNSYSTLEAREYRKGETATCSGLFASDVNERRRAFKSLFLRLPFRPLVKFVFLYFFKLGFLDGKAGFYYSTMQAFYEFMISVKLVELQQLRLTPSRLNRFTRRLEKCFHSSTVVPREHHRTHRLRLPLVLLRLVERLQRDGYPFRYFVNGSLESPNLSSLSRWERDLPDLLRVVRCEKLYGKIDLLDRLRGEIEWFSRCIAALESRNPTAIICSCLPLPVMGRIQAWARRRRRRCVYWLQDLQGREGRIAR